jgi:chromosome segregation ATPase
LASQYPGSDRARREYSQADDAAAARAPGQPPAAAAAPVNAGGAPRRSFGVWSFLFALIALVAAAVSIAGPSLRTEVRGLLTQHFPNLSPKVVDLVSGFDTKRLEVTYDGLDQRIERLGAKLEEIAGLGNVTPEQLSEVLLRTEATGHLEALQSGQASLKDQFSSAAADLGRQIESTGATVATAIKRVDGIDAELATRRAAMKTLETAIADTSQQLSGSVAALETSLRQSLAEASQAAAARADEVSQAATTRLDEITQAAEKRAQETAAAIKAIQDSAAGLNAQIAALKDADAAALAKVEAMATQIAEVAKKANVGEMSVAAAIKSIEDVADVISKAEDQRVRVELPMLALSVLRHALNTGAPFRRELRVVMANVRLKSKESTEALATLESHAANGAASILQLRRDFRFFATQSGNRLTRIEDWGQRVTHWLEYVLGVNTVPETLPAGRPAATMASIDAALEAHEIDLAIEEALALSARSEDGVLTKWIAEARRRRAVEQAYQAISQEILAAVAGPG